jgi:hypothetical protein
LSTGTSASWRDAFALRLAEIAARVMSSAAEVYARRSSGKASMAAS